MSDEGDGSRWQGIARKTLTVFERAAGEVVSARIVAGLLRALEAAAAGDLTEANVSAVVATDEGRALQALVGRFRRVIVRGRKAQEDAPRAIEALQRASGRVAEGATRYQVELDRCLDDVQRTASRARELQGLLGEVAEAADRASLLALNTGIEGMRAGGEAARALTLLGEEIRRLSQRAQAGADEAREGVAALTQSAEGVAQRIESARVGARSLAESATQASAAVEAARRSDEGYRKSLDEWRILDEETESMVASVNDTLGRLERELGALTARIRDDDRLGQDALERALARVASLGTRAHE
ncbi:MAG: hypothetical protein JNK72_24375 [Myxococcales bacterium]|nr:hypothetical protein [Myxococcales bacterium]